jgi:uncharacterized protein YndB with AHSA1/START domain
MADQHTHRVIDVQVVVNAPPSAAWEAWLTAEGIRTFFAPGSRIEDRVGGAYEIFFDMEAEPGERGSEGMTILAMQEEKMLSFTWNAPPSIPSIRDQCTHVTVRFTSLEDGRTHVRLIHDGWGVGAEWDEAYRYFEHAWGEVVLPRLAYSFAVGAVDWEHPPSEFES